VQIVGADALAETEKRDLAVGRILREDFLQQFAFSDDAFCTLEKTCWMLRVILAFYDHMADALQRAVRLEQALVPAVLDQMARMKEWPPEATPSRARDLLARIEDAFREM
jgi:V/A-type H+-transporting ATPase subunit A